MATFFHVYDALVTPVFTAVWYPGQPGQGGESSGQSFTRSC
jgi:hypothetical protein